MSLSPLPRSRTGRTVEEVALRAVRQAGETVRAAFQGEVTIRSKGRGNIVTQVDTQVEGETIALLRKEFPDFGILGEESGGTAGSSDYTWVIDPLDGTRNFAHGIPFFCVALALVKGDDPLLGLTYDPLRDELFRAAKGEGAAVNGKPLAVTRNGSLSEGSVGLDLGYHDERALEALAVLRAVWPVQTIRILGSAALGFAYAAAGRLDLYFHHHLSPWDVAGGILMVREAGGVVTDRRGGPVTLYNEDFVASSPAVHADFLRLTAGLPWRY